MMFSMKIYLMMNMIYLIVLLISIMLSVAFLTLFERKLLGYIQMRKGPNKLGFSGLFQPISDTIKLLSKEWFPINKLNLLLYFVSIFIIMILSLSMWLTYLFYVNWFSMNYTILFLMSIFSFGVYPLMIMGWASNSNYSMLSSIRSMAQSISYEVSLFLMMFSLFFMIENYNMINFYLFQYNNGFWLMFYPIYSILTFSLLIEMNRTPFDLIEGESELVSGFNIEYFGSLFTLIFLSEYMNIIFMTYLLTILFYNFKFWTFKFTLMWTCHIIYIIWIRGIMPRFRYDELMYMCWKNYLSVILIYLYFIFYFKCSLLLTI